MQRGDRVLRLFRARPVQAAFDTVLRDVLIPDLRACPGMEALWVGRRGEDELGERVVASVWASEAAMLQSMGGDIEHSRFHPELRSDTTDRHLEVHPVLVRIVEPRAPVARILRVARGRLARIDLATYAAHVARGAQRDIDRGRGPSTLLLTATGQDRFLTMSAWADWESIAAATGASPDRPVRTREQHELVDFAADHFELVTPAS